MYPASFFSICQIRVLTVGLCCIAIVGCGAERPRDNVLTTDGTDAVSVMDFCRPVSLDPISPGWHHRQFKRHGPIEISLVSKDEKPSIRLAINDTASMLFRVVDISIKK